MTTIVRERVSSIVTYTGKRVWPTDIRVDDIDPLDIAHALGNICRYNGHVSSFYSVGQHSCLVHDYGPEELRKQLLIHDATEAYIGDMVAPLKHQEEFEFYRELEDEIHLKVCDRFDLPYVFDPIVKELDIAIREAEIRDLKKGIGSTSKRRAADKFATIEPWSPWRSKNNMIRRMKKLGIEVQDDKGF